MFFFFDKKNQKSSQKNCSTQPIPRTHFSDRQPPPSGDLYLYADLRIMQKEQYIILDNYYNNHPLFANCPQAASISLPRLRRTVTITPSSIKYLAKSSILWAADFSKVEPSIGLYSMIFIWTGKSWHSFVKLAASIKLSLKF